MQMKELVTDPLAARGFLFPKVNVQVAPDKAARTAELRVEVLEEGPHAVIERVEIAGNKTNTAEAVLRYLDLKPGLELTSQLVSRIEDRLWRAARFLSYKVNLGASDAGGRVPLQIELAEYDGAPPLEQAFSPTDQALLKLREWLSKLDESGEDMIATLSGFPAPAPEGELVLSPRSGLVLRAKDATRKADAGDEYAVVLQAGQVRVDLLGVAVHDHPDLILIEPHAHQEGDVPLPDRDDLKERLLLGQVDREEGHDKTHDLVDGVHPVDRAGELLRAGEAAADLVDGEPDVRKDPVPELVVKVLLVRERLVRGMEPPLLFED